MVEETLDGSIHRTVGCSENKSVTTVVDQETDDGVLV